MRGLKRFWAIATVLAALAACGRPADAPKPPQTEAPAALAGPAFQGALAASGNEPGWGLALDPARGIILTRMDQAPLGVPYTAPIAIPGGARFASGVLVAEALEKPCVGASGETYPLTFSVRQETGEVLAGCGYRRWDNALEALIPAIDACLKIAPHKAPITFAAADGAGGVRVRFDDGEPQECQVNAAGAARFTPAETPVPGERDPMFHRAPGVNPGGECYQAAEARGKDGALLGWLDSEQEAC